MFNYTSGVKEYKVECYANLSEDGATLTVLSNGVAYGDMGNLTENMVMTVSEGGKKIEYKNTITTSGYMPLGMFTATKQ